MAFFASQFFSANFLRIFLLYDFFAVSIRFSPQQRRRWLSSSSLRTVCSIEEIHFLRSAISHLALVFWYFATWQRTATTSHNHFFPTDSRPKSLRWILFFSRSLSKFTDYGKLIFINIFNFVLRMGILKIWRVHKVLSVFFQLAIPLFSPLLLKVSFLWYKKQFKNSICYL